MDKIDLIDKCEHCTHFNLLIKKEEAIYYQCMLENKLYEKCDDFEEKP